jgi:signal transduction histidine kinase
MTPFPHNLRIGTKLTLMVLAMMALTLTISFLAYDYYAKVLVSAVQNQTEALSKALEISVQQLTSSKGETDQQLLQDYVRRLSAKGVTEISILSSERKVVASSNRAKVGTTVNQTRAGTTAHVRRQGPGNPLVVTGTIGEDDDDRKKIAYDLDVPIIINDEVWGYVRLHMILDDFAALLQSIYLKRALATSLVFLGGVAGSLALAYRMTSPLNQLAAAAERVAAGDLDVPVPAERRDEIGGLQRSFSRMLEKLREHRRLESELRRAERAGVVGRLASAVAHEIRNPLNYVNLSVDHLRTAFRPEEASRAREFEQHVGQIKDELRRLNHLVTDFLNFGRPPRLQIQPCRVDEVLKEVSRLAAIRAEQQGVSVAVRIAPGLPTIQADPAGLRTCFLNLVTNALQAMPDGGRLAIGADPVPEGLVQVTVRDGGVGIPEPDLERLFEPYFSTRVGGTGLGLAITQRIVQDHGGSIEVASRVGQGTEFRVVLPVLGPPSARAAYTAAGRAAGGLA